MAGEGRPTLPPRVRRAARRAAAAGAARLVPNPPQRGRRVVLCYHSVDPASGPLSLTPALFDAHLTWLAGHCRVLDLGDLVDRARRGADCPVPEVAITFDDGYADNHAHALPLLAERCMTASFFVTAGFLERDPLVMAHLEDVWSTPAAELAPLSWTQLAELRAAGMRVGSHTFGHRSLAGLTDEDAEADLRRSRYVLEEALSERVTAVAYPWGKLRRHVTPATFAAARRAGFTLGGISLPRAIRPDDDRLQIPRMGVGSEPVERLAEKVSGAIDWHGAVHERMPASVAYALFGADAAR